MLRYTYHTRILMIVFFSSIAILSLAFAGDDGDSFRGYPHRKQSTTDTIPGKKRLQRNSVDDKPVQDNRVDMNAVEDAMRDVERSMRKLKEELGQSQSNYRNVFDKAKWRVIEDEYRNALAQTRANLDYNKMNKQLALQQQQMLLNINRQMELSKLNLEKSRKAMQLALKVDVDKQMQKARVQLKNANKQLEELNDFRTDLEKDGLIKQDESHEIEIREGNLYINGKKQKHKISEKYKDKYPKYFEKGQQFRLNNNNRRIRKFDINEGNELI